MPPTKKRKPSNSEETPKPKKRMPLMRDWQRPDPPPRPVPKFETQELYNQWQDIERLPEGLALLEEQGIHENEFLTSPISPTRTSSVRSRSPSCASTTNSLRQALDDVEITKKKRRAIRTQPLNPRARAKAAFIRKLGACAYCHRRRVGCHKNHYDLSLFEAQYRISRHLEPLESENNVEESRVGLGAADQEQTAADIPPFRFSLGHSNDLIGVGQNLNESYPTGIQDDPDGLLQPTNLPPTRNPFSSVSGSSQVPFLRPSNAGLVNNIDYTRPSMSQFPAYPPLSGSSSAIPRSLASPAAEPRHLPIGKQLRQDREEWECLHGTNEVDASVSSGSTGACSQHCSSLSALRQHYFYQHSPFESANFMWRCISCGFNSPDVFDNVADPNESCLQCGKRNHQQRWYWGLVRQEFDLLSGRRTIQVSSQEPSTTKSAPPPSYSQNSPSGGGHNFPGVFAFTGYTNSSGSSGQYWKAASKANYMMRYVTIHPCDALAEKASPSSTPAVLLCPSKLPVLGPGLSVFAMLSLASICVVEVWLWLSAKPSPGFQSRTGFSFLDLALSVVPELSLACVAAGVIGTWLFRHARLRWAGQEHFEASLHDDGYYVHNPLSIPKHGEVLGQSPWAANAA